IHPREIIYVLGGTRPTASFGLASSSLSDVTKVSCDGMGGLTPATLRVLKNNCPSQTLWNGLKPRMDFWDHLTTAHELESAGYFEQRDGQTVWPETLAKARESSPLELSAVGGLVSYLRSLKLDKELVSLGNFNHYLPVRQATSLVLDGPTMSNLDLFTISSDTLSGGSASFAAHNPSAGVQEGTLFALINHAITPFGKRLLRRWMCHPLRHVDAINERLDVVDTLIANPELSGRIQEGLHRLPDMERLLSRIHAGSCKVKDWICLLDSLDTITQLMHMLGEQDEVKQAKRLNFL
ncbi:DNA mismatch repair protein msh6, partial [Spiromyces aspiralis]